MKQAFKLLLFTLALQLWPAEAFCLQDGSTFSYNVRVTDSTKVKTVKMWFQVISETNKTAKVGYNYSSCCIDTTTVGNVNIPAIVNGYSVVAINNGAFEECSRLKKIKIPKSVESIGRSAFYNCTRLNTLEIPDGVKNIDSYAFQNCSALTSANIPSEVTILSEHLFDGCVNLESVNIPNDSKLTEIGGSAFRSCEKLQSIYIPQTVTTIEGWAFYKCKNITHIDIPSKVTLIGGYCFYGCSNLISANIPDDSKLLRIGESSFQLCEQLLSINIPKSVTYIRSRAFEGCKQLISVSFPEDGNLLELNYEAFNSCEQLQIINIPKSVQEVGSRVFSGCKNLTAINFHEDCKLLFGDRNVSGCDKLTSLIIPKGVRFGRLGDSKSITSVTFLEGRDTIPNDAFYGFDSLSYVKLPNSLKVIGSSAFTNNHNLKSIEIPDSVTIIGSTAFENSGLTQINIPDAVTIIGALAFYNCPLRSLDISSASQLEIIGECAFMIQGIRNYKHITLPKSLKSIGRRAFLSRGSNLETITSFVEEPFPIDSTVFMDAHRDIYEKIILYVPAKSVDLYRTTKGWNLFKNIRPLYYKVLHSELIREPKLLNINVKFSIEPNDYSSLDEYMSLASKDETLKLLSFVKSGESYDLYFELPKKEGTYTLKVANTLPYLDQNGNGIIEEDVDNYTEDFVFGINELYVVAQSPTTGIKGKNGYTDVVLNDEISDIPISKCLLVSPSGKEATITKIDYIENMEPARYRIYYDALDEDGIYTFTIHKGMKSSKGWDMRYDYQSTIELPCADLSPINFTSLDGDWIVGQKQFVTYQVNNKGTMPANGKSINVLYLSPMETWSQEAIDIYRDTVDVNLQSQENFTRTIDVTVPPCVEGHYYLILKANVARSINELSFDDNTLVSEALNVSVEWLSETKGQFTLRRGESRLFKIPVTTDRNIEIEDKSGMANMYMGYYAYPNTNDEPKNGSITIVSPDSSMVYYLLVTNNEKNSDSSQPCELSIRYFDIEITNVGREKIVKHNTAWIPIEVKGCTEMPVFYLMDAQGKKTMNKDVYVKTETMFYAQFDTETLQVGKYNLYVECNGKTGMMQNAISVTNEVAQASIDAKLVLPSDSRLGSTITAYVDYKNTGNVDIPVPLFILTGEEGSKYTLDGQGSLAEEVHIMGVNEKGVLRTLLPGESNRISVDIEIPNTNISSANYKLKTITEGCDGIDEPFYLQWLDVDPDEKPACYTNEEWSAYCTRLEKNVGKTWQTFIQALGKVADMYFSADYVEHDAHFLYSILKETDLQIAVNNSHQVQKKTPDTLRDVEAGTLFVWKNGQWNQVTQVVYTKIKELFQDGEIDIPVYSGWEMTENINLVNYSASKNFIISHGWNDDRNGNTKWLAQALEKAESNCNIFGIDWSRKSTFSNFLPTNANKPATFIPDVADKVVDGLCTVFGMSKNNLRINNLHLIGHSHGAHLCGMIAHKLNFRPKRLTALDASTQLSHIGWSKLGVFYFNTDNFMGSGWSSSDVQFLDYYKSSVMAGTNRFKGNNNFILIKEDNGFAFDKSLDTTMEEIRHGYSISWFALSILNKDLKIGYNMSPNYLKDNWGNGYNESQYHGVIHGTDNRIENYSIREDRKISKDKWNYTEPWYGEKLYQGLGNDNIFQNALARTIEYSPISIDPYHDGNEYIETGTEDNVKVRFKNTADNFTIPLNVREREVFGNVANVLFISNSNNPKDSSIVKNKDGIPEVRTSAPLYILGYDINYGDISKDKSKETEAFISFTISTELWDKLAGTEKNEDYIFCDLWFIPGCDRGTTIGYDGSNYLQSGLMPPFKAIQLWKGELYPDNNVIRMERVKVKKPSLACNAGNDMTYTLGKGQKTENVNVNGVVERDNGMELSYNWEKGNSVFSNSRTGNLQLEVGSHTLTFHIKAQNGNNAKAAFAPTSSANEASDDVIITVKPYTPGDEDDESTNTAASWDPNEKVGIRGAGGKSCVRQGETMEYVIYFENDSTKAQLAAQTVTVIDTLDTAFDLSTFEFTGSEVANTYIDIPSGKAEATVYTDLRPANDLILKSEMKMDIDNRVLTVVYSSLDTLTYEPTQDVFAGFLPPNNSTHVGEGHFSYRVKLKDDVADGYVVRNQAHIFFDYNDEIATNTTSHIVDNRVPISYVEGLPPITMEDSVLVSWSGIDDGAGIKYYDIYRSKNGGEYELWLSHVLGNSAIQYGTVGDVYSYYSIATDSLGFVEAMKTHPEATVKFTNPDGITLIEKGQVTIEYDNGAFTITGAEGGTCDVYDLAGQLMASKKRLARQERIVFQRKGVYVVNVETKDGVTVAKKMIVK